MALGEGAGQHCDATSVHATLLLSIYYMPHAVLGTQDESVNKTDKCPAFVKLRVRRTISKKKKKKKIVR